MATSSRPAASSRRSVTTACLRLRPDVLAWAERVTAADPDDRSPYAAEVWVVAAHAAWTAGEVATTGRVPRGLRRSPAATRRPW